MGVGTLLKLLAFVAVVAFIKIGWDSYDSALTGKATAEAQVATERAALKTVTDSRDKLQGMLDLSDQLAKDAQREAIEAKRRAAATEAKFAALQKSDPATRAWAPQPIPPAVRELRRSPGGALPEGGGMPRPDSPSPTNPGTAPSGRDQRPTPVPRGGGAGRVEGGAAHL